MRFQVETFQTAGTPQHREVAILNEQPAALLLTYMRTNDAARGFYETREARAGAGLTVSAILNDPIAVRSFMLGLTQEVVALPANIETMTETNTVQKHLTGTARLKSRKTAGKALKVRPVDLRPWVRGHRRPMNLVAIPVQQLVTMSSREMAELVEKRHDNVKRTIETLVEKGNTGISSD